MGKHVAHQTQGVISVTVIVIAMIVPRVMGPVVIVNMTVTSNVAAQLVTHAVVILVWRQILSDAEGVFGSVVVVLPSEEFTVLLVFV